MSSEDGKEEELERQMAAEEAGEDPEVPGMPGEGESESKVRVEPKSWL